MVPKSQRGVTSCLTSVLHSFTICLFLSPDCWNMDPSLSLSGGRGDRMILERLLRDAAGDQRLIVSLYGVGVRSHSACMGSS